MNKLLHVLQISSVALATLSHQVSGFVPIIQNNKIHSNQNIIHERLALRKVDTQLNIFTQEQQLEFWITTFSTAHIGMSAVREQLINGCGEFAAKANLIDRGIKLPSYWPGTSLHILILCWMNK
jgi:hypothetical protein